MALHRLHHQMLRAIILIHIYVNVLIYEKWKGGNLDKGPSSNDQERDDQDKRMNPMEERKKKMLASKMMEIHIEKSISMTGKGMKKNGENHINVYKYMRMERI